MGWLWTLVVVLGPILLIGALVYVWLGNRKTGRDSVRRADQGARELREEIVDEPKKPVDL